MKERLFGLLLIVGGLFTLTGCFFQGADELYALPRPSEMYVHLQAKINEVKGNAEYIAPQSGNNTQTIQLVDLNHNGKQEAVVFFRDSTAEKPIKICIFSENENGTYEIYAQIEGAATEIESIDYLNLDESPSDEVVVSWKVSTTVHTMVIYQVGHGQVDEMMRSGYTTYLAADVDRDSKDEILLVQMDSANSKTSRVELYDSREGMLELYGNAPMSEGALSVISCKKGYLKDGIPALFVTSAYGEDGRITDIFYAKDGELLNLTMKPESRQSEDTVRYFTGVEPVDLDEDGVTEVPLARLIPTYNNTAASENFWQVEWLKFDVNGVGWPTMKTYHNGTDRWYLVLPEQWDGNITLSRRENSAIGERAVVFSYWKGDKAVEPEVFLSIYRLTGTNRVSRSKLGNRFVLWTDSETIYAAEFSDCSWGCGLNQETLSKRFHLSSGGWFTEPR